MEETRKRRFGHKSSCFGDPSSWAVMLGAAASGRALASGAVAPCATPGPHRQPWRPAAACTQRRAARHWQQRQQRQQRWHGGGGSGSGAAGTAVRRCLGVCAALKPGGTREKLPIFPLGMVALPSADVPLQVGTRGAAAACHRRTPDGEGLFQPGNAAVEPPVVSCADFRGSVSGAVLHADGRRQGVSPPGRLCCDVQAAWFPLHAELLFACVLFRMGGPSQTPAALEGPLCWVPAGKLRCSSRCAAAAAASTRGWSTLRSRGAAPASLAWPSTTSAARWARHAAACCCMQAHAAGAMRMLAQGLLAAGLPCDPVEAPALPTVCAAAQIGLLCLLHSMGLGCLLLPSPIARQLFCHRRAWPASARCWKSRSMPTWTTVGACRCPAVSALRPLHVLASRTWGITAARTPLGRLLLHRWFVMGSHCFRVDPHALRPPLSRRPPPGQQHWAPALPHPGREPGPR